MRKILLLTVIQFAAAALMAQSPDIHASLEAQGIITSSGNVPFWMRSNQYGSIPLSGTSGSLIGAIRKDYDSSGRLFDWGAGVEARADLGSGSRVRLIQGYAKARLGIFQLRAGRYKNFMGLCDSTLSSGAFAVSGNALGVPSVELSIPDWWSIPGLGDLFAIKGNFSNGWLGKQLLNQDSQRVQTNFHQASIYGRFGKPDWKVKLYAGINHQVYWGSEEQINGPSFQLSGWKTFQYVVLGKTYHGSKVGNHLGSFDLGFEYDMENVKLQLYRQFFYDEGALAHLDNLADGLNGISLQNKREETDGFRWNKIVLEFFYSKNQAGYPSSKPSPSGDENYYNNYQYADGWSYKGLGLGNPFITPSNTTRAGLPNQPGYFFNNNRVMAFYLGMDGSFGDYRFLTRWSWSKNYGTFATSQYGYSTGSFFHPPTFGIFKEADQLSGYLEVNRVFPAGWQIGVVGAIDNGHLFYNSGGLILKVSKSI